MFEFFRQFSTEFWLFAVAFVVCASIGWAVIYYATYAVRSMVFGKVIWCGHGSKGSVALTFDDGPSPDTMKILDVLRDENIKATFFLIGENVEKYPEIARKIAAEGHEIGNHSYSHPIYLFCTPARTRRELEKTQEIIKNVVGFAPRIARPPCGVRTPAYFAVAEDLNLKTVQWSDAGFDWKKISAAQVAEKVLETVQSDSIILLHDGDSAGKNDRQATAEALPIILRGLREKDLQVAPLAEICPEINEKQRIFNF